MREFNFNIIYSGVTDVCVLGDAYRHSSSKYFLLQVYVDTH